MTLQKQKPLAELVGNPRNDEYVAAAARDADVVVVSWGKVPSYSSWTIPIIPPPPQSGQMLPILQYPS